MKTTPGGLRGSFPVPTTDPVSGATISLLVESSDGSTQILLDAGTGVLNLLPRLRPGALLALTHFHLDHLLGLPLLVPSGLSGILTARPDAASILSRVYSPPVWPVPAFNAPFALAAPGKPHVHGALTVAFHPVAHPDGCHAIRIDEPATGERLVLATDIEWALMDAAERAAFADFARGAEDLWFDCHFLPAELPAHRGWGHSSWQEALETARLAGAKTVHPLHFSPASTEATIAAIRAHVADPDLPVTPSRP
jgi:ribonuclease BN (tRNA processing enzyme)